MRSRWTGSRATWRRARPSCSRRSRTRARVRGARRRSSRRPTPIALLETLFEQRPSLRVIALATQDDQELVLSGAAQRRVRLSREADPRRRALPRGAPRAARPRRRVALRSAARSSCGGWPSRGAAIEPGDREAARRGATKTLLARARPSAGASEHARRSARAAAVLAARARRRPRASRRRRAKREPAGNRGRGRALARDRRGDDARDGARAAARGVAAPDRARDRRRAPVSLYLIDNATRPPRVRGAVRRQRRRPRRLPRDAGLTGGEPAIGRDRGRPTGPSAMRASTPRSTRPRAARPARCS